MAPFEASSRGAAMNAPDKEQPLVQVASPQDEGPSATTRFTQVIRLVKPQKEVTISMTTGKFAKNDLVVHWTGLNPTFDLTQAVQEAANAMVLIEQKNPILLPPSGKSKALIDKALKSGKSDDEQEPDEN